MKNEIVVLLGGRMAEKLVMDDISTGASNDIQRATQIAKSMVTRYGMSDLLGPVVYGSQHSSDEVFLGRDFSSQRDYSEDTAASIDAEVKRIVCEAYELAEKLLGENMDKLHFIAEFLMKNEVMDEYQFEAAMNGSATTVEQLEGIKADKKKASEEENAEKARRELEERRRREEEERRRLDEMLGRTPVAYPARDVQPQPNNAPQNAENAAGEGEESPVENAAPTGENNGSPTNAGENESANGSDNGNSANPENGEGANSDNGNDSSAGN